MNPLQSAQEISINYWCTYFILRQTSWSEEGNIFFYITNDTWTEVETVNVFDKVFHSEFLYKHAPIEVINKIYELIFSGLIDFYQKWESNDLWMRMYAIESVLFNLYGIYKEWEPELFVSAKTAYIELLPRYINDIRECNPSLIRRLQEWLKREKINYSIPLDL